MTNSIYQRYEDLIVPFGLGEGALFRLRRMLGQILQRRVPARTLNLAQAVLGACTRAQQAERDLERSVRLLQADDAEATAATSGYGYPDAVVEIETALRYRAQIASGQLDRLRSESGVLYAEVEELLVALVRWIPKLQTLVEFGVSYAHVLSRFAAAHRAITCVGIDRSPATKALNEACFTAPNLFFLAGDVFTQRVPPEAALLHMRTACLLPPAAVSRLYRWASAQKVRAILGAEQVGISWQTGAPYQFTNDASQPSVVYRNRMFIHNYPGLLHACGYWLAYWRLVQTAHPESTLRMLTFVAVRRD